MTSATGAPLSPASSAGRGATAGGVIVTLATFASHLLGYLLNLLAARWLGPAGYGAVAPRAGQS